MGVRAQVVTELRAALPDTFLIPDKPALPAATDAAVQWVVVVERANVKPGPSFGLYIHELHLILAVQTQDPDRLEDELDDALDDLLEVFVTSVHDYGFVSADRDTFANTHCYDLTISLTSTVTKETSS